MWLYRAFVVLNLSMVSLYQGNRGDMKQRKTGGKVRREKSAKQVAVWQALSLTPNEQKVAQAGLHLITAAAVA